MLGVSFYYFDMQILFSKGGIVQYIPACILDVVLQENTCVSSAQQYRHIFAKVNVSPS
jgi:hypothetical protein